LRVESDQGLRFITWPSLLTMWKPGCAYHPQMDPTELDQTIAAYQVAHGEFHSGRMRSRERDATRVQTSPAAASPAAIAGTKATNP
jgi:hypothetical protein